MNPKRQSPRHDYRQRENLLVMESPTLADKFDHLKSLTVDLVHFGPQGLNKTSEFKYTVNLAHARSFFRFHCSNEECVAGDFDLSAPLANAVAAHEVSASGQVVCQGWRNKTTIDREHCCNILRYHLSLGY